MRIPKVVTLGQWFVKKKKICHDCVKQTADVDKSCRYHPYLSFFSLFDAKINGKDETWFQNLAIDCQSLSAKIAIIICFCPSYASEGEASFHPSCLIGALQLVSVVSSSHLGLASFQLCFRP